MNSASPAKWRFVTKCRDRHGLYLYIYDNERSRADELPHNHTCPPDSINSALRAGIHGVSDTSPLVTFRTSASKRGSPRSGSSLRSILMLP